MSYESMDIFHLAFCLLRFTKKVLFDRRIFGIWYTKLFINPEINYVFNLSEKARLLEGKVMFCVHFYPLASQVQCSTSSPKVALHAHDDKNLL